MRRYAILGLVAFGFTGVLGMKQAAVAGAGPPQCGPLHAAARSCGHVATPYESTLPSAQLGLPISRASRLHVRHGTNRVLFRASTVRLPGRDLRNLAPAEGGREVVTLTPGIRHPAPGSTLLFAPGRLVPQGLAAVVDTVTVNPDGSLAVAAHDGSLSDIYRSLSFAGTSHVGSGLQVIRIGPRGRRTRLPAHAASAVPFSCKTSGNRTISVTADLSKTWVSPTIDLGSRVFAIRVISRPTFSLGVSFSGSAECSLGSYFALAAPIPAVPGLVVSISPYFTLTASGEVSANVSWDPTIAMEAKVEGGKVSKFVSFTSKAEGGASGSAAVSLAGGIEVKISVAKQAGFAAKLGPQVMVVASVSGSTSRGLKACIDVSSEIDISVELFAHVLFVDANMVLYRGGFFHSTLFHRCAPAGGSVSGSGGGGGSASGGGTSTVGGSGYGYAGPASLSASNNGGQLAVQLANFPAGTTYYFCHTGAGYPTGGSIVARGEFTVTAPNQTILSGLCGGSGNFWIGLQATDGHDYYSDQVFLGSASPPASPPPAFPPPPGTLSASNNNGQLAVQLSGFPLGTTYFFCHSGNPGEWPTGGVITSNGSVNVTSANQSWASGLCSGRGNAWIGMQGTDGRDYYSNQVNLEAPATPGAEVSASNNNGQMVVQLQGYPLGTTYFFCHSGNPGEWPTGGVITSNGSVNVTSANQSWASGLCSGRGNAWIGLQAPDGHDYYSNQVNLEAPATPGASIAVFGGGGQLAVQFTSFPTGLTYYFCHAGPPSAYPYGGTITSHGPITLSSPNLTTGTLCSGSGNTWVGVQATDGHDYYSNQIII
jgi:hypothetical protein